MSDSPRLHRLACCFATIALLAGCATPTLTPPEAINPGTPWPATDALGRDVHQVSTPGGIRPNRCVGIFYFLTHDDHPTDRPYDISKILAQDPDVLSKPNSPLWGPPHAPYYWGEPLYGYYNSTDPWVLRRHAHLLADAGIDTVIFDTTNRVTYRDVYLKLCEVWSQVRREGGRTPHICFMVNTLAHDTAEELYRDFYQKGLHPELWFRWQGKPLLICDPAEASPEVRAFFTLRKAHWPLKLVNTQNAWHWEAAYPQVYSYAQDPAKAEQVNVAVAQNLRETPDAHVTNMSQRNARGRGFHAGKSDHSADALNRGLNFAEQWQRALELDPPFVMVTGWNEWTAGKYSRPNLPVVFVDQFDQEYSRDIEPVTGLHEDNYYHQLVNGVRRYKGAPAVPVASMEKSIRIDGSFAQWTEVRPEFVDHAFDTNHRDFGKGPRHYVNQSGRNDLVRMKVARDSTYIYFYAQTRSSLTPTIDPNWMLLLLDIDQNHATGWEGYDFVINRTIDADGTWLERNTGGWTWEKIVKVPFTVRGNELMVAIPRIALGVAPSRAVSFDFKWWDNPHKAGDIMDVYLSGDAAPDGRFNYRYRTAGSNP